MRTSGKNHEMLLLTDGAGDVSAGGGNLGRNTFSHAEG